MRRPAFLGLALVVLVAVLLGYLYATNVPKWNAPDEPAHFNYVRHLATTETLPVLEMGAYDHRMMEERMSAKFPDRLPNDWIRYESHQPPLYYALATPIYLATAAQPIETQVLALRLFSTLLGAVGLVLAFLLVRQVFPKDELLAFAVPGIIAFVPMRVAMYAAVENDALAEVAMTAVLLALVVGLKRETTWRYDAVVGVLLAAALLTKAVDYLAVVLVAAAYLVAEVRRSHLLPWGRTDPTLSTSHPSGEGEERARAATLLRPREARAEGIGPVLVRRYAVTYGVAATLAGWWFVRNLVVYGWPDIFGLRRHDAVVAGQPLTAQPFAEAARHFVETAFNSFWAQFGWMGILVDSRVYTALTLVCAAAAAGLLAALIRVAIRRRTAGPVEVWAVGLLALGAVGVAVGVVAYNLTYLQPQGRYFFATLPTIGLALAGGLREICPRPLRPAMFVCLVAGLAALTYLCLARFVIPYFAS